MLRLIIRGLPGLLAVLALALALPAGAQAAKPITGKLSKPGYTVIALGQNRKADSVRVARSKFRLRPPGKQKQLLVTLQLRAPDGVYAGPVVVDSQRHGRRAILGVRPGAKLGMIKVNVAKGYGKLKGKPPKGASPTERYALAKKGVPIGNGRNVGRVRSTAPGHGGDQDLDGVPDVIDVDDDGDLVLDDLDTSKQKTKKKGKGKKKARAAQGQFPGGADFFLGSGLGGDLSQVANANAPGVRDAEIEGALPARGSLGIGLLPPYNGELDCAQPQSRTDPTLGGLVYCSRGGTGTVGRFEGNERPFPECCDPDGDGFGTLVASPTLPSPGMFLHHGATSAQIGAGDLLIQRVSSGGAETDHLATLQYVFVTTPALVSYSDGQGNSATVSYPGSSASPGIRGNSFPVAAGPNGEVVVTLTFWRPQRRPIPPEKGKWIDMGGLVHSAAAAEAGLPDFCEQSAYSNADPNLTPGDPTPSSPGGAGFRDLAPDQAASPANTFTYTLNLTQCLASKGLSFNPGEQRGLVFRATPAGAEGSNAEVHVWFERQ